MVNTIKSLLLFSSAMLLFAAEPVFGQFDIIRDDWPMFADPPLTDEVPVQTVSDKLIPTWIRALNGEEQELRLVAAKTIGRAAELEVAGLEPTIQPLIEVVANTENYPLVRHTAAMSLVQLDAKDTGERLLALVKAGDFGLSAIVEPAFARWQTPGAVQLWRARLSTGKGSPTLLRLSLEGLASIGTAEDHQSLMAYAVDDQNNAVMRITAAQSLVRTLAHPELEHAGRLAKSDSVVDRLIAASLSTPEPAAADVARSLAVITELMNGTDATVYAVVLEGLVQWNPQAVLEFKDRVSGHWHARVRGAYVDALNQTIDVDRLAELALFTNDKHPKIRVQVRQWLLKASETEALLPGVIDFIQSALIADQWRSQEQALHLAVALDQKQVAMDVLKLLRSNRDEVVATAGWTLRRLAVPETLPPLLAYCEELLPAFENETLPYDLMHSLNEQFAHVFQMFGEMKYRDSITLLHKFIRKHPAMRFRVRAAAVWAAGKIFEGDLTGDPKLEKVLLARLNDLTTMPPEDELVKRMAAIGLARIGSKGDETISSLWKYYNETKPFSTLRGGTEYALNRLIGEEFPTPDPRVYTSGPWLIEPYDPPTSGK